MGCKLSYDKDNFADVAELVDAPDLGSGFSRSVGSSPIIRIPYPGNNLTLTRDAGSDRV